MTARREIFFATCAPGIEAALHAEVDALKFAKAERQISGVYFEGDITDAWRANLWLRTAIRVLLRVGKFPAADGDELYRGAKEVDWRRFLTAGGTLRVEGHTTQSQINNGMFIAQRVKDAIVDQFRERGGRRPDVSRENADLVIHANLVRDRCTLSVDTSGDSLHKRGWRQFQGRAPLAETTAAAMLIYSEWDKRAPLIDPFCGSGTILIEAALMAANIAPGLFRERFGFQNWPRHDAAEWGRMKKAAMDAVAVPAKLRLIGRDKSRDTIAGAKENFAAAGFGNADEVFAVGDAIQFEFRKGWNGWIVSNPPYGVRVGERDDLDTLYGELGRKLRAECAGYRVALLCGNSALARKMNLSPDRVLELINGALPCELLLKTLG